MICRLSKAKPVFCKIRILGLWNLARAPRFHSSAVTHTTEDDLSAHPLASLIQSHLCQQFTSVDSFIELLGRIYRPDAKGAVPMAHLNDQQKQECETQLFEHFKRLQAEHQSNSSFAWLERIVGVCLDLKTDSLLHAILKEYLASCTDAHFVSFMVILVPLMTQHSTVIFPQSNQLIRTRVVHFLNGFALNVKWVSPLPLKLLINSLFFLNVAFKRDPVVFDFCQTLLQVFLMGPAHNRSKLVLIYVISTNKDLRHRTFRVTPQTKAHFERIGAQTTPKSPSYRWPADKESIPHSGLMQIMQLELLGIIRDDAISDEVVYAVHAVMAFGTLIPSLQSRVFESLSRVEDLGVFSDKALALVFRIGCRGRAEDSLYTFPLKVFGFLHDRPSRIAQTPDHDL